MIDEGFLEVFVYDENKFIPSKRVTENYYNDKANEFKSEYEADGNYDSFNKACHALALHGQTYKLEEFLNENTHMYSHLDDKDSDVFAANYPLKGASMVSNYNLIWEEYRKEPTEEPFPIPAELKDVFFDMLLMKELNRENVLEHFGGEFEEVILRHSNVYTKGNISFEYGNGDYGMRYKLTTDGVSFDFEKAKMYDLNNDGEDEYILVYTFDEYDYMTILSSDKKQSHTFSVKGIEYESLKIKVIDDIPTFTFDRAYLQKGDPVIPLQYINNKLVEVK